ncbi:unnamed protein product [Ectocarpus sp. 12 AP-2014]
MDAVATGTRATKPQDISSKHSLDLAKSHAAEMMSRIAAEPSTEFGSTRSRGAENEANDATTGGGGGGGSGSGGNTAADRIDVEVSYILLAMRSGSAGEGSGASPPTEQGDLLSTWSMAAPAVFDSLVSPEPNGTQRRSSWSSSVNR